MYLIRKIKGPEKSGEICDKCVTKKKTVLNDDDDVCGETATASSSDIDTYDWLTEEDKNLIRYYYYILHEVDDVHAGTLDSKILKKITSMVTAEWQKRHSECFEQLIRELKRDYVTSMKKSVVDFVLQEPFEEIDTLYVPVSIITCII